MPTPERVESDSSGAKVATLLHRGPDNQWEKTGLVLSADARRKLQALADWLEGEYNDTHPGHRRVQYGCYGAVCTIKDWADPKIWTTYVSCIGALVQMYEPFKLSDAMQLTHTMWRAPIGETTTRASRILGITYDEVLRLWLHILKDGSILPRIIDNLRSL